MAIITSMITKNLAAVIVLGASLQASGQQAATPTPTPTQPTTALPAPVVPGPAQPASALPAPCKPQTSSIISPARIKVPSKWRMLLDQQRAKLAAKTGIDLPSAEELQQQLKQTPKPCLVTPVPAAPGAPAPAPFIAIPVK